jgi:hypothetical protein
VAAGNWVDRRRSLVYPVLMSLGVGVLGSCAEKPAPPPTQTVAVEPPPPAPAPPPRRRVFRLPAHKPVPPGTVAGSAYNGAESMALAAPEEPAAHPPSANQLIGLDQAAAKHLLGAASEQSEAPPATVWRYRSAVCELDLFFYLDLRSGKMRTLHYAFKGGSGDREDCLRSLVVAHRA